MARLPFVFNDFPVLSKWVFLPDVVNLALSLGSNILDLKVKFDFVFEHGVCLSDDWIRQHLPLQLQVSGVGSLFGILVLNCSFHYLHPHGVLVVYFPDCVHHLVVVAVHFLGLALSQELRFFFF